MAQDKIPEKQMSGFARFGLSVLAIVLLILGALLIIVASNGLFTLDAVGLPAEAPGLAVIALSFYVLFRARRQVRDDGQDSYPGSHHAFPRDVEDQLDSAFDDDDRDT